MDRRIVTGEQIPSRHQEAGFAVWNRFAAVNDEFIPIHMDDEAGRAAGYDGAFGMGYLQWSLLHNVVRDWAGDDGRITAMTCTFRGPSLKGRTIEAGGIVTEVREEADGVVVELDVWTRTEDGSVLAPGTARVVFP